MAPSLFTLRLSTGARAVVGVEPQGSDDRGRPGALAFHALILSRQDYRRIGGNPFLLAPLIRSDWSIETTLPTISWPVALESPTPPIPSTDPRVSRAATAIARGRRVAVESLEPLNAFASEVWRSLPVSKRCRGSMATWAFGNANRFDLLIVPRLSSVNLDPSYLDPSALDRDELVPQGQAWSRLARSPRRILGAVSALALLLAIERFSSRRSHRGEDGSSATFKSRAHPASSGVEPLLTPEEADQVGADLRDLADLFEGFGVPRQAEASEIMLKFSTSVRYRGPLLSEAEQGKLAEEPDLDRDMALGWQDHVKRFVEDVPLPLDFRSRSLPDQLVALGRAYSLDPSTRARDVPRALARLLARSGLVRPTPLASRYPPLSEQARFLGRLPRHDGSP